MSMCMRYAKDKDVAIEIINNGFLKVFMKLHTFGFKGSLEGWIRKLVFHALSDYYKKQSKNIRVLELNDFDKKTTAKALDNLYFEDVIKLVDYLPNATREVFWLYAVEGFTHKQISEKLSISSGTSKWHLSNARKKLKELLTNRHKMEYYAG